MACCMTMVFQLYLPRINDRFCWAIGIDIHITLTSFHTLEKTNLPVLHMSGIGRFALLREEYMSTVITHTPYFICDFQRNWVENYNLFPQLSSVPYCCRSPSPPLSVIDSQ